MATGTVDKPVLTPFAAASLTGLAVNAGGDVFPNNGKTYYLLDNSNAGAGSVTVTVNSRILCSHGVDHDLVVSLTAGQKKWLPLLPRDRFNDASGNAAFSYSGTVTGLTIAAVTQAE